MLGVLGVTGGVRPGPEVGNAGAVGLGETATGLPFVHVVQPATAKAAVTMIAARGTTKSLRTQ